MIGYSSTSEAPVILGYHYNEISRYVIFDEDIAVKKSRKCQLEETYEEFVSPRAGKLVKEVAPSLDNEIVKEHDMLEP